MTTTQTSFPSNETACGKDSCNKKNCSFAEECEDVKILATPGTHKHQKFACHDIHYNRWPYGLGSFVDEEHSIPYVLSSEPEHCAKDYHLRHVVYMVGQNDTCNDALPSCHADCWKREDYLPGMEWPCFRNHMDTRCPAMLEGPYRRIRGELYMRYLKEFYGSKTHLLHIIPNVGHNGTAMFGSDIGMTELFD